MSVSSSSIYCLGYSFCFKPLLLQSPLPLLLIQLVRFLLCSDLAGSVMFSASRPCLYLPSNLGASTSINGGAHFRTIFHWLFETPIHPIFGTFSLDLRGSFTWQLGICTTTIAITSFLHPRILLQFVPCGVHFYRFWTIYGGFAVDCSSVLDQISCLFFTILAQNQAFWHASSYLLHL